MGADGVHQQLCSISICTIFVLTVLKCPNSEIPKDLIITFKIPQNNYFDFVDF